MRLERVVLCLGLCFSSGAFASPKGPKIVLVGEYSFYAPAKVGKDWLAQFEMDSSVAVDGQTPLSWLLSEILAGKTVSEEIHAELLSTINDAIFVREDPKEGLAVQSSATLEMVIERKGYSFCKKKNEIVELREFNRGSVELWNDLQRAIDAGLQKWIQKREGRLKANRGS